VNTSDTNEDELSEMMVGHPVQLIVEKDKAVPKEVVLEVKNLSVASSNPNKDAVRDVSFAIRAGEIVCLAGISGNGQTELVYALTGLVPAKSGEIWICGEDVTKHSVKRKSEKLSHIPEDRHKHGLVLDFPLEDNLIMRRYREKDYSRRGIMQRAEIRDYGQMIIENNNVSCGSGVDTKARNMSGGNQQKAIIGRELDMDRPLIIAVYPTRGVDVGAIEAIHKQLVAERDRGKAVLVSSVELSEVKNLADRILVMYDGEIAGELDPEKTTYEEIGLYMAGGKKDKRGVGADEG